MDMDFSVPVHMDGYLLVDIIDNAWAADVLPLDDIEVPVSAMTVLDDDDMTIQADEAALETKWTDLALHTLSLNERPGAH